jgi:pSer/pThr/pTyr-binding forkhead associated (FHA) protein
LIVHRGPGQGSRFLLDQDLTVAGRHPEADIFLDDVTVSRRHAQFLREGRTFTVSDMGSMNGTYVDGQSTETQQLITGMEVMIGKFRLTFYASEKDR